jgi:hypothetical protein
METSPISCTFSLDSFFPNTTSHYTIRISVFVQKDELKDNLALHVRVEQREEICQYKTSVFVCIIFSGKGKQPNSAAPRQSLEVMKEKRKTHFVFHLFFGLS